MASAPLILGVIARQPSSCLIVKGRPDNLVPLLSRQNTSKVVALRQPFGASPEEGREVENWIGRTDAPQNLPRGGGCSPTTTGGKIVCWQSLLHELDLVTAVEWMVALAWKLMLMEEHSLSLCEIMG